MSEWEQLRDAGRLDDAVVAYVRAKGGGVSFVEIRALLEPAIPVDGGMALHPGSDENLIIWPGMSREWSNLMTRLLQEQRIFVRPTVPLVYMVDGMVPSMPVAKNPPPNGYKEPHWAPVCLYTEPAPGKKRRGKMAKP